MAAVREARAPPERFWQPPPASSARLPNLRAEVARLKSPALRISRVAQLDAALLDDELEGILQTPVSAALDGVKASAGRSWQPEFMAMLRLAVLKLSLWESDATLQKAAYTALVVLPPYLQARLQDRILDSSWADEPLPRSWFSLVDLRRLRTRGRRRTDELARWSGELKRTAYELLSTGERLGAVLGLSNLLIFLYNGKFRTLLERVLKMRLVYARQTFSPNVSFEFLNRQLVWEAFTEFLLFLLPLINLHRFRLRVVKAISSRAKKSSVLRATASVLPAPVASTLGLGSLRNARGDDQTAKGEGDVPPGPYAFLPPQTCPICYSTTTGPPSGLGSATAATAFADPTLPSASLLHGSSSGPSGGGGGGAGDTAVKIPYVANCRGGCRYCYYCIVGTLVRAEEDAEESWTCLRCGDEVTGAKREEVVLPEDEEDEAQEQDDELAEEPKEAAD
ncbi:peroxisome assembly protein (Peroxin-2) [Rhodotorula sphaerocarpa]